MEVPSSLWYRTYQILNFTYFLCSRLAVVFVQSIGARYYAENEDVDEAAPTTSEWSKFLFPTGVRLILEDLRYLYCDTSLGEMCSQWYK